METQKKYRLLKELPRVEAGEIFEAIGNGEYKVKSNGYKFISSLVENNPEWFELIPENKMEVVEGYTGIYHNGATYFSKADHVPSTFKPATLINNITPLMKQVVKQIEKGECYLRHVSKDMIIGLRSGNNEINGKYMLSNKEVDFENKIIIIPMGANNG